MTELKDILAYIVMRYPYKMDLSNARVTKLIYLSDWHQSIHYKKTISDIEWYFDNYGPFVNDVKSVAIENPDIFKISQTHNYYGWPKSIFEVINHDYQPTLTIEQKSSIDFVIEKTSNLTWNEFIKLIYSTYPITSSSQYSKLDLINKAIEYNLSKNA